MDNLDKIPAVVWSSSLILLVLTVCFSIVWLVTHGGRFKFRGIEMNSKGDSEEVAFVTVEEKSISCYHIEKFKELKRDFNKEIPITKEVFLSHFKYQFIGFLKDIGYNHMSVESNEHTHVYNKVLNNALDSVFTPMTRKVIFENHWPVIGDKCKEGEKETQKEFEKRFYKEVTEPNTITVMDLTKDEVSSSWEYFSKYGIDRTIYEENYVLSDLSMGVVLDKTSQLFIKCRKMRDLCFEQIQKKDGTSIEEIKEEWKAIYG